MLIVKAGITCYTMAHNYDDTLNATNYLKKDKNYYMILKSQWSALRDGMDEIFSKLYYK
jgi:hypothetical protein